MLAYITILATALMAFFGAPLWSALIGTAVLATISFTEQRKFTARFADISATHVLNMAAWQSAGHAALASCAAFAIGAVSRLALLNW